MSNSSRLSALAWLYLRVSGILVLFLALGHLYIMHIANSIETIDSAFAAERLSAPVWRAYDFLLLTLALSHGGFGINNILQDCINEKRKKLASGIVLIVCAALFVIGLAVFIKDFKV
ncbi:MAG: succinate dehydrogenase [Elusimicrobiota bacterium]